MQFKGFIFLCLLCIDSALRAPKEAKGKSLPVGDTSLLSTFVFGAYLRNITEDADDNVECLGKPRCLYQHNSLASDKKIKKQK